MITRRQFIKLGATGLAGAAVASFLPSVLRKHDDAKAASKTALSAVPQTELKEYDWTAHTYGFVVDSTKCIGCGKCVLACKTENHVPMVPRAYRTWVERYVFAAGGEVFVDSPDGGMHGFDQRPANVKYDNLRVVDSFFVPKLCNHCEKPPCVQVCPVAATYKTKDGVILVDQKRCIGCGYCIQACPYGARYLVPEGDVTPSGYSRVADKCTWCYHRITKGMPPACVEVCPVGARLFGDTTDPNSTVSKALLGQRVYTLKPSLGTEPKVYYIGIRTGVN